MRGNKPMPNSKLHVLLNISAPCWWIFMTFLYQGCFWWDDQNEGWQPYANFKTACFVEYLSSMLINFHETSTTGILLMRQLKWVVTSKLPILLNISASAWEIFMRLLYKNYIDETIKMRGNHPMLTSNCMFC